MKIFKILVITPIQHIRNISVKLNSVANVDYFDDPSYEKIEKIISKYNAIFTNPNKSKIFLDAKLLSKAKKLQVIATASTGTNHIDLEFSEERNIKILSLTKDKYVIEKISSTAELAFSLTLAGLRNIIQSHNNALLGEWDYTKYIGRQMNALTVGVLGYGRLGKMYSNYCKSFGSKVVIYDPYKTINDPGVKQINNINMFLNKIDVLSIHVHVSKETSSMINKSFLEKMKTDVLIVNTSRGEIINEIDLINFLRDNPNSKIATDVLANEINGRKKSPLFKFAKRNKNVIITQHIGGMTVEAQEIAYNHTADKLIKFITNLEK